MTERHRDIVILLHGLARSHRVFWRMEPAIRAAGFETLTYRYASRKLSLDAAVRGFSDHLNALKPGLSRVHFVGFSLGGLIARGALAQPPPHIRLGRLVMIGTPNRGAAVLGSRGFARAARAIAGPAVDDLSEGSAALERLGTPQVECAIVAGTGRFYVLNPSSLMNVLRRNTEPHDGTVELRNTKLDGVAPMVCVAANHTLLCRHPAVIAQTVTFLKTGSFRQNSPARRRKWRPQKLVRSGVPSVEA
jgi:pimeloyl-ACP methyl ester carboxylesterase